MMNTMEMNKLDVEVLAYVAGGSMGETASDTQMLNDLGYCPDRFGDIYTMFHWGKVSKMVDAAWAQLGIRSITKVGDGNRYEYNGDLYDRMTIINIIEKMLGVTIPPYYCTLA